MTVQIRDSDGTVRLSGDLLATGGATGDVLTQQADGTYVPAPGGVAPTTREELGGTVVTIADNATAPLPWGNSHGPDVILDTTTPTAPTVAVAGVYAVFVDVFATTNLTPDGFFVASIEMDPNGFDAQNTENSPLTSATHGAPRLTLCATWYLPAGAQIVVSVQNKDGSAAADFKMDNAHVQRIS